MTAEITAITRPEPESGRNPQEPGTTDKQSTSQLAEKQLAAIDLICMGKSFSEVARTVWVTRQTISRWFNHDPKFRLALEERRTEAHQASVIRLRGLVPRALDVLERALSGEGALKAAVQIVKMAGLHNEPAPLRPEDVGDLEEGQKWRSMTEAMNSLNDPRRQSPFGTPRGQKGKGWRR